MHSWKNFTQAEPCLSFFWSKQQTTIQLAEDTSANIFKKSLIYN